MSSWSKRNFVSALVLLTFGSGSGRNYEIHAYTAQNTHIIATIRLLLKALTSDLSQFRKWNLLSTLKRSNPIQPICLRR